MQLNLGLTSLFNFKTVATLGRDFVSRGQAEHGSLSTFSLFPVVRLSLSPFPKPCLYFPSRTVG